MLPNNLLCSVGSRTAAWNQTQKIVKITGAYYTDLLLPWRFHVYDTYILTLVHAVNIAIPKLHLQVLYNEIECLLSDILYVVL